MSECRSGEVVVVDDDEAVLDSFRFMLESSGFEVSTFSSATAFLDCGRSSARCLIVDQHMPAMTGLDLSASLRASGDATPILLITSSPSPAMIDRASEIGVEQVLEKPVAEAALLGFVASCGRSSDELERVASLN